LFDKKKLIAGSASIFPLKTFIYDLYLYLYFCFWPAAEFIVQSNNFIFIGFILGLCKLILKKNQIEKSHLITVRKLTFVE